MFDGLDDCIVDDCSRQSVVLFWAFDEGNLQAVGTCKADVVVQLVEHRAWLARVTRMSQRRVVVKTRSTNENDIEQRHERRHQRLRRR